MEGILVRQQRGGLDWARSKQHSTGDKERLGGIFKQGNRYIRWLLVVIRHAKGTLTERAVAVALANKIARMAWADEAGEPHRSSMRKKSGLVY